jgi:hypothetical protein
VEEQHINTQRLSMSCTGKREYKRDRIWLNVCFLYHSTQNYVNNANIEIHESLHWWFWVMWYCRENKTSVFYGRAWSVLRYYVSMYLYRKERVFICMHFGFYYYVLITYWRIMVFLVSTLTGLLYIEFRLYFCTKYYYHS